MSSSLKKTMRKKIRHYLAAIDRPAQSNNLLKYIINEVEKPVLDEVLKYTGGNQTVAASMLGISRNTLQKKMKIHKLDRNKYS